MNKNSLGIILALVFAGVTAGGFYWLWTQYNNSDVTTAVSNTSSSYTVVDIESVKNQASEIISSLEKVSDIPIPTPTAKMGRTNPFVAP